MQSGTRTHAPIVSIRRWPRLAVALAALLVLAGAIALALGVGAAGPPPAKAQASAAKPNIVVLLTDDQESRSMRVMKRAAKLLKRKGVTMKRFYDNFPLCCPSRSTILTGQYAHNHNVLSNSPPDGGYGVFNELHGEQLPADLAPGGRLPDLLHRQVPERVRGAGRVRDRPVRRSPGLEQLACAGAVAGPVLQLHAQQQRLAAPVHRPRGGLLAPTSSPTKAKRFIRSNAKSETPFYLAARLRRATRRRRRRPRAVLQPRRGPGAPPPRDPEGQVPQHAAALVQRGGHLRQAVADLRSRRR